MIVLGKEMSLLHRHTLPISIFMSTLYVTGSIYMLFRFKKTNALLEIWCFFILTIWTLYLTFI